MADFEPHKPIEDLLLERHLDHLDPDDRRWLELRAASDPSVHARDEALGRIMEKLDALPSPAPMANVADRALRYVDRARTEAGATGGAERQSRPVHPGETTLPSLAPSVELAPGTRVVRFNLRDLLAVAACIGLLLGVLVPTMQRLHSHARRVQCVGNLASVYQALSAYGREFHGALPHAGTMTGASWLYTSPGGAPHSSNSRHPYLLVGLGFLPRAEVFRCPSAPSRPPTEDGTVTTLPRPVSADDFNLPSECTYDTLNMAGAVPNIFESPRQAYMSDANPLFVHGVFRDSVNPNNTNSPVHEGGRGQNVLKLDGSTDWLTSPFRTRRDNLWLAGDLQEYTGTEAQTDSEDAFLVPATPASKARRSTPAGSR